MGRVRIAATARDEPLVPRRRCEPASCQTILAQDVSAIISSLGHPQVKMGPATTDVSPIQQAPQTRHRQCTLRQLARFAVPGCRLPLPPLPTDFNGAFEAALSKEEWDFYCHRADHKGSRVRIAPAVRNEPLVPRGSRREPLWRATRSSRTSMLAAQEVLPMPPSMPKPPTPIKLSPAHSVSLSLTLPILLAFASPSAID